MRSTLSSTRAKKSNASPDASVGALVGRVARLVEGVGAGLLADAAGHGAAADTEGVARGEAAVGGDLARRRHAAEDAERAAPDCVTVTCCGIEPGETVGAREPPGAAVSDGARRGHNRRGRSAPPSLPTPLPSPAAAGWRVADEQRTSPRRARRRRRRRWPALACRARRRAGTAPRCARTPSPPRPSRRAVVAAGVVGAARDQRASPARPRCRRRTRSRAPRRARSAARDPWPAPAAAPPRRPAAATARACAAAAAAATRAPATARRARAPRTAAVRSPSDRG